MALMEFFGCLMIAFGPSISLFFVTITRDPLKIILLVASAFFWLLSLLVSSLLWFAVVPLRQELAFGLVFSVIFQELFRFLLFLLLKKAEEGFQKILGTESEEGQNLNSLFSHRHSLSYVCGLGFGVMSGAFSLVNVLRDMTGPGTVGINGDNQYFFFTSSMLTSAFILLHVSWGVIFFDGLKRKGAAGYAKVAAVVILHMGASCITLLPSKHERYWAVVVPIYVILLVSGVLAFITAGGRVGRLVTCCRASSARADIRT